jgi:hypothetical protein
MMGRMDIINQQIAEGFEPRLFFDTSGQDLLPILGSCWL